MTEKNPNKDLTFGGHLEVLRRMLFRILGVTAAFAILVFCFKEETFNILFAPSKFDFITYQFIERLCHSLGLNVNMGEFHVQLISTQLTAQFMAHLTTSALLGLLLASPYIVYELFAFISPALYESERRYSIQIAVAIYVLFIIGMLLSYYVIFPISFRFLGTYQVATDVVNQITIDSYISSFIALTFGLGLVFQIPIVVFFLSRMGLIDDEIMRHYRRHAILVILICAAIITPSVDIFTLLLTATPLCLLYECSIRIARRPS